VVNPRADCSDPSSAPLGPYDAYVTCRRNVVITIAEIETVDAEIVAAFETLIPQLSRSNPAPDQATLQAIADSEASTLLIARDDEQDDLIVGSMTLAMFRIPTGLRAWIEDVVVDESARGKGVGRILNERAIEIAHDAGASTIDLTSRPSREAANRLYRRIGFVARDTNVYRYTVE
jgi:ribosomal protein S18 acetylase RimI-like enzyme